LHLGLSIAAFARLRIVPTPIYLELARGLGLPLATRDASLAPAAKEQAWRCSPPDR
jgi:hypothetical protein